MTPPTANPAVGGSSAVLWPGRLWLALLVVGIMVLADQATPRHALDLGEGGFAIGMLMGLPLFALLFATIVVWLWTGVTRLVRRKPHKWEPWLRIGIIALVFLGLGVRRSVGVAPNPITPESESIYVAIAMIARDELGGSIAGSYLSLDPKQPQSDQTPRENARARLDAAVPAYWPRAMLYVLVEEKCVVLARGSGMLGTVGVRIYDHGPSELYSNAEHRRNPYLPRQQRITDRLWYFTSD